MATTASIQQATQKWLENIVIGFNFCPFARKVFLQDNVAYRVCTTGVMEEMLEALVAACQELDANATVETTLLIFPNGLDDFGDYLELLNIAESLLEQMEYTGIYQLASFHPQYVFGGTTINDVSNYTNRSPYPMLHLLREESLENALEHYPNPAIIPEQNIALANQKSLATWQALLQACYTAE
ncbi:MAG: DUF1415 domain-containing protein [Aureispira sp.]